MVLPRVRYTFHYSAGKRTWIEFRNQIPLYRAKNEGAIPGTHRAVSTWNCTLIFVVVLIYWFTHLPGQVPS